VRQTAGPTAGQAIAAGVAAAGYDSDEEVYATARAMVAQDGGEDDEQGGGAEVSCSWLAGWGGSRGWGL